MRPSCVIVHTLLEDGEDIAMDMDELLNAADVTKPFDDGAEYIMRQARTLYSRLAHGGALEMVRGISSDGIAQAVIRRTLEVQPTVGGDKAYKLLRRHARFIF